jgi:hypothetical protein
MTFLFPDSELASAVDAVVRAIDRDRKKTQEILDAQLHSLQGSSSSSEPVQAGPNSTTRVSTALSRLRQSGQLKSTSAKTSTPATSGSGQPKVLTVTKTATRNRRLFDRLATAGVEFHDKKGRKIVGAKPKHKAGTTLTLNAATRRSTLKSSSIRDQSSADAGVHALTRHDRMPGSNNLKTWQQSESQEPLQQP